MQRKIRFPYTAESGYPTTWLHAISRNDVMNTAASIEADILAYRRSTQRSYCISPTIAPSVHSGLPMQVVYIVQSTATYEQN